MKSLIVFDAIGMKWMIEDCPCKCGDLWVHLYDDNNYREHSGSVEPDLESAMLFLDGYMGEDDDISLHDKIANMKLVGDTMSYELPDTGFGCRLKERWIDATKGLPAIDKP